MTEGNEPADNIAVATVVRGDDSGEATRAIIESLREAARPVTEALRGALSQEEYRLFEDLQQAMEIAERVVKAAWEKSHPDRIIMC
ncbi:MAG TPA: hypothetical protein VEC35_25650 [Noviherbaspirillum sp.]|nr:hypothetical protein [Noviherbaspirillum sp.]